METNSVHGHEGAWQAGPGRAMEGQCLHLRMLRQTLPSRSMLG